MSNQPTQFEVRSETEGPRGWTFDVQFADERGVRTIELRLDWTDYDHWSHGSLTPSDVAVGALKCAAALVGAPEIPARLDASILRRLAPGFDEHIGAYLSRTR